MNWMQLVAVARANGYTAGAGHPEAVERPKEFNRALWKAAMAKRGGPLTEYNGIAVGAQQLVDYCLSGKVEV